MTEKQFELPDVGEGVAEGELVNWVVDVGETVTEDQVVAEVETDKALVEVPSPYDGTVAELHAAEGEMVPVGDVIVTYDLDDGAGSDDEAAEGGAEATADDRTETASATAESTDGAAQAAAADGTDEEVPTADGRTFAPPSARRIARELGVDVGAVDGSGPGGRITEADVRAHAENGATAEADADDGGPKPVEFTGDDAVSERTNGETTAGGADAVAEEADVERADRDTTLAAPATRRVAEEAGVDLDAVPTDRSRDDEAFVTAEQVRGYAEAQRAAREREAAAATGGEAAAASAEPEPATTTEAAAAAGDDVAETRPYRGIRQTIGEQMAESKYTAPHVTHHDTVTIPALVETRERLKTETPEDVRLTYMPFVMKAVVAALEEFPILNSQLREEEGEIAVKSAYNLGVAVATDAGLMVPVVEDVDRKGLAELAREVNDLASRARSRDLAREEMQGGTFTLTNFGAIGGEYATPIINYPETAILGLGAIEQRPVVEDGEVVAQHTLPLSLSIDHRVVDGAEAAQFTNRVMEYLRTPELLLL
ncbi:MAG: dihydrolipoamide acetyltransferase family protein [Halolamina sp.]